ncbi:MAG: hypothetical protein ACI35S_00735 [Anaeroplasma sp.]
MSTTVDQKVVSMEFDNRRFERNVKTSLKTIDKLKKSTNFDESAKSLNNFNKAANDVDMSKLSKSVESVQVKFSGLQVIAMTALSNITTSAMNAGKRMIESLSIDNLTYGWTKYEQKTSSVQTLLNSTGKSIDEVNGYLNKLMWYSDQTSYGFTDMTSSLAQLTSSGGDIEKLIPMIEGIANATAFAGKGAAEFSRVIYNLNQSYSAGYLQYMDWKSLDLAGVTSKQLKQTLIDAGIELGKISEGQVTIDNFAQTLSDRWADTEVMEMAFGKFAELTEKAYALMEENPALTINQAMEQAAVGLDEISVKAFQAAQEYKSFADVVSATKDAVSSGWMQTYELIFGNYEEGKKLWTTIGETFYDIFASGAEVRNSVLEEALAKSGWDKLIDQGIKNGDEYIYYIRKVAKRSGIEIDKIIEEEGSLQQAIAKGKVSSSIMIVALNEMADSYAGLSEEELKNLGYTEEQIERLKEFNDEVQDGTVLLDDFIEGIDEVSGKELIFESISNILDGLSTAINAVKEAFSEIFGLNAESLYETLKSFNEFTKSLVMSDETAEKLKNTIAGLLAVIDIVLYVVKGVIKVLGNVIKTFSFVKDGILDVTNGIGGFLVSLRDLIKGSGKVETVLTGIQNILVGFVSIIKSIINTLSRLFGNLIDLIVGTFKKVYNIVKEFLNSEKFIKFVNNVKTVLVSFINAITDIFKSFYKFIRTIIDNFMSIVNKILNFLIDKFKRIWNVIVSIINIQNIKDAFEFIKNSFINFVNGVINVFNKLCESFNGFFGIFKSIFVSIRSFLKSIYDKIKEIIDSIIGRFKEGSSGIVDAVSSVLSAGALAGIGVLVYKFCIWLIDLFRELKGPVALFKELLMSVSDAVNSFTRSINAKVLKNIAISIGILVLSLFALTFIDYDKLMDALAALSILFVQLGLTFNLVVNTISGMDVSYSTVIKKGEKTFKASGITKIVKALTTIATAMFMLSITLKILSTIDLDSMASALFGLTVTMIALSYSFKTIVESMKGMDETLKSNGNTKNFIKIIKSIKTMCSSLILLSVSLLLLSKIDWNKAWPSLLAIGIVLSAFTAVIYFTSKKVPKDKDVKQSKKNINAFTEICIALSKFALALALLTMFSPKSFNEVLAPLALLTGAVVALAGLCLALRLIEKIKVDVATANKQFDKLSLLCMALLKLSLILTLIAKINSWESIKKSISMIIPLIGLLMGLLASIYLLKDVKISKENVKNISKMLNQLCLNLLMIGGILFLLSLMSWKSIAKTLVIVSSVLVTLVGISLLIEKIGKAGKSVKSFSSMILDISKAMLTLTASLFVFTAALKLLELIDFSGLFNIIPKFGQFLLAFMSEIIKVFTQLIPMIVNAVMTLIKEVLTSIEDNIVDIASSLFRIIIGVLDSLSEFIPQILDVLFNILIKILEGIRDFIPELMPILVDIVKSIFNGLKEVLGKELDITSIMFSLGGVIGLVYAFKYIKKKVIKDAIDSAKELLKFVGMIAAISAIIGAISMIPINVDRFAEYIMAIVASIGAIYLINKLPKKKIDFKNIAKQLGIVAGFLALLPIIALELSLLNNIIPSTDFNANAFSQFLLVIVAGIGAMTAISLLSKNNVDVKGLAKYLGIFVGFLAALSLTIPVLGLLISLINSNIPKFDPSKYTEVLLVISASLLMMAAIVGISKMKVKTEEIVKGLETLLAFITVFTIMVPWLSLLMNAINMIPAQLDIGKFLSMTLVVSASLLMMAAVAGIRKLGVKVNELIEGLGVLIVFLLEFTIAVPFLVALMNSINLIPTSLDFNKFSGMVLVILGSTLMMAAIAGIYKLGIKTQQIIEGLGVLMVFLLEFTIAVPLLLALMNTINLIPTSFDINKFFQMALVIGTSLLVMAAVAGIAKLNIKMDDIMKGVLTLLLFIIAFIPLAVEIGIINSIIEAFPKTDALNYLQISGAIGCLLLVMLALAGIGALIGFTGSLGVTSLIAGVIVFAAFCAAFMLLVLELAGLNAIIEAFPKTNAINYLNIAIAIGLIIQVMISLMAIALLGPVMLITALAGMGILRLFMTSFEPTLNKIGEFISVLNGFNSNIDFGKFLLIQLAIASLIPVMLTLTSIVALASFSLVGAQLGIFILSSFIDSFIPVVLKMNELNSIVSSFKNISSSKYLDIANLIATFIPLMMTLSTIALLGGALIIGGSIGILKLAAIIPIIGAALLEISSLNLIISGFKTVDLSIYSKIVTVLSNMMSILELSIKIKKYNEEDFTDSFNPILKIYNNIINLTKLIDETKLDELLNKLGSILNNVNEFLNSIPQFNDINGISNFEKVSTIIGNGISNLYYMLVRDLDNNIFKSVYFDPERFKTLVSAISDSMKYINDICSNYPKDFDGKSFNSTMSSIIDAFKEFIDKIMSIDNIEEAKKKLLELNDCLRTAKQIIETGINSDNLTIRPVLDLTNVESGMSKLNRMVTDSPAINGSLSMANSIYSDMNSYKNYYDDRLISLVDSINNKMDNDSGNVININGITYSDGSEVQNAIETLLRATKIKGRI